MLLTPFTPIVCPASWLTVLIRELAGTTSARVSGDKMEASARIRNRAPAAWGGEVGHVAPGADVDLARQLLGDD
jgi:hypothetical protein